MRLFYWLCLSLLYSANAFLCPLLKAHAPNQFLLQQPANVQTQWTCTSRSGLSSWNPIVSVDQTVVMQAQMPTYRVEQAEREVFLSRQRRRLASFVAILKHQTTNLALKLGILGSVILAPSRLFASDATNVDKPFVVTRDRKFMDELIQKNGGNTELTEQIGLRISAIATEEGTFLHEPEYISVIKDGLKALKNMLPNIAVVVVLLAVAYNFKKRLDLAREAEVDRQERLKRLFAEDKDDDPTAIFTNPPPPLEEVEPVLAALKEEEKTVTENTATKEETSNAEDTSTVVESKAPEAIEPVTPKPASKPVATKTKKRRFSVFGKKNTRETDLSNLVADDAKAPQFALLLAQLLTYGAPGRFDSVKKLTGSAKMPMAKYDADEATKFLTDAVASAGLSPEEAADIFANVVNCMLVEIVDLASASLKEKDSKVTVAAINIVVDFMAHAATLYDSIAEGVAIEPVTYSGRLSKSQLEDLFSAYAASGLVDVMNLNAEYEVRVNQLRDVFNITEKRSEFLMMKEMQKSMMEMMKTDEGKAKMEGMMKGFGGGAPGGQMPGMPGMPGGMPPGQGMSPEMLKETLQSLKAMKDSGHIGPKEINAMNDQFKQMTGTSMKDMIAQSKAPGVQVAPEEKELMDLMEAILE